uniref:30S ribosomal protein S3 n=1 Tax=Nephromyces sp. ex Molgula occidentalis TaxID=2544991 RepID=A0A5C1H8L6_9APIC|nr:30S ribosomal protein S3 [Nephromyces sp. ex Molgula occidentalis]
MGRKVFPNLFRINYYPKYKSFYKPPFTFTKFNNYILNIQLNLEILNFFQQREDNYLILDIKIINLTSNIIIIYLIIPDTKIKIESNLNKNLFNTCILLKKNLYKKYNNKINIFFELIFSKNVYKYTNYIWFIITKLLKQQISIRSIFKNLILDFDKLQQNQNNKIIGFKLKVSGRINGSELAKQEIFKFGSLPLQTIIYDINYTNKKLKTKFGILGIKLWLFIF